MQSSTTVPNNGVKFDMEEHDLSLDFNLTGLRSKENLCIHILTFAIILQYHHLV